MSECTTEQLSFMLLKYVLNDNTKFSKLQKYKKEIIQFMNKNNFNGNKFINNISRKEFEQLVAYLGDETLFIYTVKCKPLCELIYCRRHN